jgi:hypothetical protein
MAALLTYIAQPPSFSRPLRLFIALFWPMLLIILPFIIRKLYAREDGE